MRNGGFTVVEAGVVTIGLAVGAVMATVAMDASYYDAAMARNSHNLQLIGQAYSAYMSDHNNYFPPNDDRDDYLEYQTGGEQPSYMMRHPDAIMNGPHAGPWDFTDKLAVYMTEPNKTFNCDLWLEVNGDWSSPRWYEYEPYHPTVHTSYVQNQMVGYPQDGDLHPPRRLEDLPAQPSKGFVLNLGTPAQLGGSGIFDNVNTLVPEPVTMSFIHRAHEVQDQVGQRGREETFVTATNSFLFADMHVEYLRYWDVWDNSRGESDPGTKDGMYYMKEPDPSIVGYPERVE